MQLQNECCMHRVFIAHECCTMGPPRRPHACDSYNNITMYGKTEVTPVLHGCQGSFLFYQFLTFGYQANFTKSMMKFEVCVTNFVVIVIFFHLFQAG